MHYNIRLPAGCRNTIFNLDGDNIPYISDDVPAIFLGKPIGAFLPKALSLSITSTIGRLL